MDDLSGDIYVSTDLDERGLTRVVCNASRAVADSLGNIETSALSLTVRRNPDREAPMFGQYGYIIEFEPKEDVSKKEVTTVLCHLLQSMWEQGMRTETACDYEDELPHSGRYDGSTGEPIVYDSKLPEDLDPKYRTRLDEFMKQNGDEP